MEKVNGAMVTSAFFREANIQPPLGRLFRDEEYQMAESRVVVIAAFFGSGDSADIQG